MCRWQYNFQFYSFSHQAEVLDTRLYDINVPFNTSRAFCTYKAVIRLRILIFNWVLTCHYNSQKPAASSKKKKKQKQKEEARVSETVETPDIVTPSIPAEFRESTAEPSSNSSAKEEKTQDDKESAAVQEIEAGIQTLHVEEVSDDEEPQPPQDSQIEGSSVRSDIGEDELESEHVSDNPFDLLLNPNGRRPPQDLPKGNGQTNRRKSRGGGREPTISGKRPVTIDTTQSVCLTENLSPAVSHSMDEV